MGESSHALVDFGAGVLQQLALNPPDRLIALHLSGTNPYLGWIPDDLNPAEQQFVWCLGGKGSADLALSGVGRVAVVRLYRYVDDGEALELSGELWRERVAGSAVVGQHTQCVHALAVGVDQPHLSVAIRAGRRVDLHPQLWTPLVADELGGALPGLSRQCL